ncbi:MULTISPECIES: hypothetical protein [Streptomyces]|uniref:Secreted protein n=2 Tax=Streptomyces TaxID=1883 RepID=A0ABS9JVA3_9ACTN|nr:MULTISPECIES: hypothetical protein [Streptomyces]MCG0069496.1 hypothetical protein [Streptomyces tricolor]OYP20220.1 hypothetical protein CFC35_19395 [Streptomyces sp. FBKL.4005]
MRRRLSLVAAAAALLVPVASVDGAADAAEQVSVPGSVPATLCTSRDAYPPSGGTTVGGVPKRYKYTYTPYAGARFDGCTNTLRLYYGGYSSPRYAFYEIRYTYPGRLGWYTWQMPMGERQVATVQRPAHGDWNFKVRACARSIDEGPNCTGWSPQLFLHAV